MKHPINSILRRSTNWILVFSISGCFIGCKKSDTVDAPAPAAPVFSSNNVGDNPSPLLQAVSGSKIAWKQLTPSTMSYARESDKLVMVLACSSFFAEEIKLIEDIESVPLLLEEIEKNFVPVVVDIEACREMGIISSILSQETSNPLNFPYLIWLSADGNPVSWAPLRQSGRDSVLQNYINWHKTILTNREASNDYLKTHSRDNALARSERLKPKANLSDLSSERQKAALSALANLHGFYEKDSLAIAQTGSQMPIQYLDIMRASALSASLPLNIRKTSQDIFISTLRLMLKSAAVDFIDGGFYFNRKSLTWQITGPNRNAITQADMICLLADAYKLSNDESLRDAALRTMEFLELYFGLSDGTYRTFNQWACVPDEQRLWTIEDLQACLSTEEFSFLKSYCHLQTLGNIPYESDAKRNLFRKNSLIPRESIASAAASCSLTELRADELLISIRTKLSKKRQLAVANVSSDTTPDALATLRAASAATALYRMTGKERWKDLAHKTMQALRRTFHADAVPSYYAPSAYPATTDARAGLLAQMAKSSLDYYHISGEQSWLDYANTLCNLIESAHLQEHAIEESPASARLVNVPCYDQHMLLDVSTVGILRQNLIRMEQYGLPRKELLYKACMLDPSALKLRPVIHTDYLTSILYQDFSIRLSLIDPKKTSWQDAFRLASPGVIHVNPQPTTTTTAVFLNKPDEPITDEASLFRLLYQP